MRPFRLHRPTDIREALELQQELGSDCVWYAGGTELMLAMSMGVLRPKHLIDVKRLNDLDQIRAADGVVEIGSTVTHQELAEDPWVWRMMPVVGDMERRIGNWRVRSTGTLAGNLAFAEPRSDPATLLLACDAEIALTSISGSRRIKMSEFIEGPYSTARGPEELITSIRVPEIDIGAYLKFQTIERPTVGVAIVGSGLDGRFVGMPAVSIGAAAPQPTLSPSAAALLEDQEIHEGNPRVREAGKAAAEEVELLDDITGSARFKARLIQALLPRAIALIRHRPPRAGHSE